MSASGAYAADCRALFGRLVEERPLGCRASAPGGAADGAADGAAAIPPAALQRAASSAADEPGVSLATRDRSLPGAWRFHFLEARRVWREEFREPFLVPGAGYVPMESAHPAELAMAGLGVLGCFEDAGGGGGAAGGGAGGAASGGSWRAGAHALYLTWLADPSLQQPLAERRAAEAAAAAAAAEARAAAEAAAAAAAAAPPPKRGGGGGLFACFGCGGGDADDFDHRPAAAAAPLTTAAAAAKYRAPPPPLTAAQLRQAVAGVPAFKGLPLASTHPYWRMLAPDGPDEAMEPGAEEGEELEVLGGAGAAEAVAAAQAAAQELGDDVGVDVAEPLEWRQR